jgi:hypothetical protein
MFKGKKGKQFAAEIGKRAKTFVPGAPLGAAAKPAAAAAVPADVAASQAAAQAARQQDMAAIKVSANDLFLPSVLRVLVSISSNGVFGELHVWW